MIRQLYYSMLRPQVIRQLYAAEQPAFDGNALAAFVAADADYNVVCPTRRLAMQVRAANLRPCSIERAHAACDAQPAPCGARYAVRVVQRVLWHRSGRLTGAAAAAHTAGTNVTHKRSY